ncbi:Rha family transcriptional regulator [Pasteurella multocida]|uniref:hypothetical protein n=1 Tax=Pasteurella multocida TaxID=747 RepID=UPI002260ACE2|nr:hypothetical protein [Pasteurella multocida]UZV66567.1 hypothetical protein OR614_08850 [Pasteurella multocida]
MNTLITLNNENLTMSSREIAELVDVRHDNVRRTIETLADKGVITLPQIEEKPYSLARLLNLTGPILVSLNILPRMCLYGISLFYGLAKIRILSLLPHARTGRKIAFFMDSQNS